MFWSIVCRNYPKTAVPFSGDNVKNSTCCRNAKFSKAFFGIVPILIVNFDSAVQKSKLHFSWSNPVLSDVCDVVVVPDEAQRGLLRIYLLDDLHRAFADEGFNLLYEEDVGGYVEAFGFEDGGELAGFFEV